MASKEYLVEKILQKNDNNDYIVKWSKFQEPREVALKDLNCSRALAEYEVLSSLKRKNLPPYKQIMLTSTCVVVEW